MKPLKGTKTHQNLKDAFAGESQANRRYLYFANKADVEGQNDVAALFRSTAEGETGHAHGHLQFLEEVGAPATGEPIGSTALNLKAAIAGELPDVGSRERPEIVTRADGSLLIDGHLPIDELQRTLGRRDMTSGDYFTVAGFVLARLGRIPKSGEVVTWRGLRFEVIDMDGRRIDKVTVVVVKGEPRAASA